MTLSKFGPGERMIPVDGEVSEGTSFVDEIDDNVGSSYPRRESSRKLTGWRDR